MRSAIYSLFTTLLLLVPISAVPLMAIFGVPQFTPVVASPLEEADDVDWDRSSRKKTRTPSVSEREDDADLDFPVEENWSWDDSPQRRPRSLKKDRPGSDIALPESSQAELKSSEPDARLTKSHSPRLKSRKTRPIPEITEDDDPVIRTVANEIPENEPAAIQSAGHAEEVDLDNVNPAAAETTIPSYRRPRLRSDDPDEFQDNPDSRKKRNLSAAPPLTWQRAVQRLNDLGIRNFRLEAGVRPGEFHFSCSYTPSNTPHVTRKFEAEANDPLKAVAKVLSQVEEASQQRVLAAPRRLASPNDRREAE